MSEKPLLFGTDGVRGVAGHYPLDRETVAKLGLAVAAVLERQTAERPLRILLGEDTRESSGWISRLLAAGLRSRGMEVVYTGVITTPGVAYLTRRHGFVAGVMVSASHNPYQDNGIKILSSAGTKLAEPVELEIERELGREKGASASAETPEAALAPDPELRRDYVDHLAGLLPEPMHDVRFRIVVDCAHGSTTYIVPPLVEKLGIEARILHAEPTGRNINLDCGSLHPERMARETKAWGADLGVAFDGDGDRAIFATRDGRIADGDHVLYAMALFLRRHGALKGDAVVGTLMTNLGLELALGGHGIGLKRTPVGDKYVLDEMLRSGINLGGEPSGHIIFSDISLAGDGIITLLEVLKLLAETRQSLDELVRSLQPFPQVIRNVPVREKLPLESIPEIERAVADCRREFGPRGRAIVRYSGTERVARVMVEADDAEAVERHAARIAGVIGAILG
ncbi:MAG TPA: phosphoglucosamine mutase [Terriglobia bacterium]|nr:phosphoglucosamine mutase [Terriglobia bacterium]